MNVNNQYDNIMCTKYIYIYIYIYIRRAQVKVGLSLERRYSQR